MFEIEIGQQPPARPAQSFSMDSSVQILSGSVIIWPWRLKYNAARGKRDIFGSDQFDECARIIGAGFGWIPIRSLQLAATLPLCKVVMYVVLCLRMSGVAVR